MLIWYLARGAGIAAFATLSVATGAGAFASRRQADLELRVVVQYVHRAAAVAGLALLILHIGMILADSYAHVGWVGALVPFTSAYRPLGVSLGVTAAYLLLAVAVTGMLRARFVRSEKTVRLWRRVHLLSYAAWAAAAWHFLVVGTDSGQWWARAVLFAGIAVVAAGIVARLSDRHLISSRRPIDITPQQIGASR